jgi:uncharacterized membrane protein YhhN
MNPQVSPLTVLVGAACAWMYLLHPFETVPVLHLGAKAVPAFLLASVLASLPERAPRLLSLGFMFSAFGDILVEAPGDSFAWGMGLHLIARLCFGGSLWYLTPDRAIPWALPYVVAAGAIVVMLSGPLPDDQLGIAVYALAPTVLLWRATVHTMAGEQPRAWLALAGALLLGISDTLIGSLLLVPDFALGRFLIMSAYWLGMLLLGNAVWHAAQFNRRRAAL